MRELTKLLGALSLALNIQAVLAAQTTLQYFDLGQCVHGRVTDELLDVDAYKENSTVQQKAHGRIVLESTMYGCYGYCSRTEDTIVCDLDSCPTFPLAGATYKKIDDKSDWPSYRCVSGCKKSVPMLIHDLGYEPEEGALNLEFEKMSREFDRVCNKK